VVLKKKYIFSIFFHFYKNLCINHEDVAKSSAIPYKMSPNFLHPETGRFSFWSKTPKPILSLKPTQNLKNITSTTISYQKFLSKLKIFDDGFNFTSHAIKKGYKKKNPKKKSN
jgi:hypothetical protein